MPLKPIGSCPYVTTVGGTQLNLDKTESGADFSSGGFSNYFAAPSYQTSSVSSYIQNLGSEYQGLYNATGRGLPDVATIGVNFTVAGSFGNIRLSGTSASTPVFAGIIALLNDELIAAGKSPLGFLNPFLYSEEGIAALNDITTGNSTYPIVDQCLYFKQATTQVVEQTVSLPKMAGTL